MPRAALALFLLSACAASASGSASTSSGTVSPGAGSEGRPAHVGDPSAPGSGPAEPAAGGAGAGASSGAPVAATPCVAGLADTPTSLFGTRMILRLPKGVALVEQNPFFAQAASPSQATNCGHAVTYVASGFFQNQGSATTPAIRDQLMELRGLPAASLTWEDEGSRGRTYTGAYSAPADDAAGRPAVRGWFVMRDGGEMYTYFTLFEADPAVWDAVKPVFVASGKSLVIKPRSPASATTAVSAEAQPTPAASSGGITAQPTGKKTKK